MKFLPVFSLRLRPPFYSDGGCPDFSITPTADTRGLLDNHRCVLKGDSGGARVLTPLDGEGKALIPVPNGAKFTFALELDNPDFAFFTDIDEMGNQALYSNQSGNETKLSLVTGPAHHRFANVEIRNNGNLAKSDKEAAPQFEIRFEARLVRWKYYVLLPKGETREKLRIEDTASSDPLVFGDENHTDLAKSPDSSDELAMALARQYPNMRGLRLVSDRQIPCRQASPRHLRLYLGENKLANALPNPSFRNYAKTKVRVNGALEEQDSLFQVVKFPTTSV